ncbi:MAG: hypothetical protein F6K54_28050 [Okeania sp. SIO3B5]|uniref:COP23 domain-containing protein n=1 Tax=Okeania sp. SIO3B5 TaxID=2607811 RepID=UPI001400A64B|nr:COP23 domain-containing protein [Okeania sp. SIO3B5]NEO56588.1 hypothetical protein [Okeania sp. SIO3B5]
MNFQFVKQWATISCFSLAVISGLIQDGQAQQRKASFFCSTDGGKPATIARLPQPNGQIDQKTLIIWETNAFQEYPAEKRCLIISQKFQDNQDTGDLKFIVSGKANGWPVLCASKENHNYIVDCPDSNILMTLLAQDNSQEIIKKLVEINTGSSTTALRHSSDKVLVSNGNLKAINVGKWMENSPETNIPNVDSPETNIEENNQCMWNCE